jgi:hypothetical protein
MKTETLHTVSILILAVGLLINSLNLYYMNWNLYPRFEKRLERLESTPVLQAKPQSQQKQ